MKIKLPEDLNKLKNLKAGDLVELTTTLYTARDAAHMRIAKMLENDEALPIDFTNAFIYYAGPTPTKPGQIVGSIGPTTSARMDGFANLMPKLHVLGTIGKGPRSEICSKIYMDNKILYLLATGGCGALLSKCVISLEEIAFQDLGTESIKRLEVKDFPVIVAIDQNNNNLFGGKNGH